MYITGCDIRLVGGSDKYEGRVEVCFNNNQWGTVCGDYWNIANAQVVCKQLGYVDSNPVAFRNGSFGQGNGSIYYVECAGTEYSLFNCSYNENNNCHHSEDAGVRCRGKVMAIMHMYNNLIYQAVLLEVFVLLMVQTNMKAE